MTNPCLTPKVVARLASSNVSGSLWCLEECSTEIMDELREQEELPEGATMIHVGLDGVMMRMNAEKNGDEVIEEAGWREASCGVVTCS